MTHLDSTTTTAQAAAAAGCPFHAAQLPTDGTPFRPSPTLAEWRAEAPATRVAAGNGTVGWYVTRYETARKVLEDPRFSAAKPHYLIGQPHDLRDADHYGHSFASAMTAANLHVLDGPQHARIRRAVTSRFSVRSVRSRFAPIAEVMRTTLAELRTRETAELHGELARPVATFAVAHILGVPESLRPQFFHPEPVGPMEPHEATELSVAFVREMLEIKGEDPGDDTASDLAASELTGEVALGVLTILLGAGVGSVAYMMTTSVASLLLEPDQFRLLRGDPSLIGPAVEELVRFNSLFMSTHPRSATEDLTIDGVEFAEGDSVWVSPIAANRDPDRFESPDTLDVTRDAYGHIAFGHGVHACIGQQIARALITETITQLIEQAPDLRLIEAEQLEPMPFEGDLPVYPGGRVVVAWN